MYTTSLSAIREPKTRLQRAGHQGVIYLLSLQLALPFWAFSNMAHAAFNDATLTGLPVSSNDAYGFAIGDVNGDDFVDVVVANKAQSHLLINDGNGAFADETDTRFPVLSDTTVAVEFVDLNDDSALDLVLANTGRNRVLINDGSGHFSDESIARLPSTMRYSMGVQVGLIDQDAYPDIFFANRDQQNQVFINDGSGVFSESTSSTLPVAANNSFGAKLVDINDDGALDIYVINQGQQNRLLMNNGLGEFADETATRLPEFEGESNGVVIADFTGDTYPDIAIAEGAQGVRLLENDGFGVFTDISDTNLPLLNAYTIKLAAGDIDFDGSLDLLLANAGQDNVLINDGNGNFSDETSSLIPTDETRSFGVTLLDADNDLDMDALLAAPLGQNRILINIIDVPRILMSVTPDYIEVGDPVSISVEAVDEDGLVSTLLEIQTPSGNVLVSLTDGEGEYIPTEIGLHAAVATAEDTLGNIGIRSVSFDVQSADTTDPDVTLIITAPTPITEGQSFYVQVSATDDRVVDLLRLEIDGVVVPLDISGQASYLTTGPGTLNIQGFATDEAGNEGSTSEPLEVQADTVAPEVDVEVSPDPVDITNPVSINSSAIDDIGVTAHTVTVEGPGAIGGIDLVLNGAGEGSYTPYVPGSYTVTATAIDSAGNTGTAVSGFLAEGIPDDIAPTVTISITPASTVALSDSVTIQVQAVDNIFVSSIALTINGTPVALDGSGSADYTPPVLGDFELVATASDTTGNEGTASRTLRVVDPASDSDFPVVSLTAPTLATPITGVADVIGSVEDATLVEYQLAYAPLGSSDFTTFYTGYDQVIAAVLGEIDSSLMLDGLYNLRLLAIDIGGRQSSTMRQILVSGEQFKVGNFSMTFTDMVVKASGIDFVVKRTYDSRRRGSSTDFGYGWHLEVVQNATYINNIPPGEGWLINSTGGFFNWPCGTTSELSDHVTEVRFSDTEFYRFVPDIGFDNELGISGGCTGAVDFVQVGGNPGASLFPVGESNAIFCQHGTGACTYDLGHEDFGYPWQPKDVRLTTADGREFDVNLNTGLNRIGDSEGNSLFINQNSIVHNSSSGSVSSLSFTRDGSGRITAITDPMGNSVTYSYDGNGDLLNSTDRDANSTAYVYDSAHYLTEIIDPLGNSPVRNEYDDSGRLVATVDNDGNRIDVTSDIGNGTSQVTNRSGAVSNFNFNEQGLLTSASTPAGEVEFTYDADGNRTSATDPLGNVKSFTYNAAGNLLTETSVMGDLSYSYNAGGQPTSMTAADGSVTNFTYDSGGRVTAITNGDGAAAQTLAYDGSGRVTQQTMLGKTSNMTYDTAGNLGTLTGPGGQSLSMTYDANGNRLTEMSVRTTTSGVVNDVTTNTYSAGGKLLSTTNPLGDIVSYTYDGNGKLLTRTDPLGNVTAYEYDTRNYLSKVTYPDGVFEAFAYDPDGRKATDQDTLGRATFYEYDDAGRLESIVYPDGATTSNIYDATGNLLSVIDALSNVTSYEYDANNRRTRITDALGNETLMTYYDFGALHTLINPLGEVTTFAYDTSIFGVPRLVRTIYADGSERSQIWGESGRVESITDELGNVTAYEFGSDQLLARVINPLGGETTYTYDEAGNKVSQIDAAGRTTSYSYDAVGNLLSRTLPSTAIETFTYDAVGNRLSHTDFNSDTTTQVYDSMSRIAQTTLPSGATVEYTYTGSDQVETVTDALGVSRFDYDSRDRIVSVEYPNGKTLSYSYDVLGNRLTMVTPDGTTSYTYDSVNRLSTVVDIDAGVTTYAYDGNNNILGIVKPNGVETTLAYDVRNRTASIEHRDSLSLLLASFVYEVDAVGNRTKMTDQAGRVVDYIYDDLSRLLSETDSAAGVTIFSFDAVGNRLTQDVDSVVTNYTYDDNNQLVAEDAKTLSYDNNGNLVSIDDAGSITLFAYDGLNRLISYTTPAGAVSAYSYDHLGNRVSRDIAGTITNFLVDPVDPSGLPQVVAEMDDSDTTIATFSYGHDLLSTEQGASRSYFHTDALGSTRLLTDSAGSTTDTYDYNAYGEQVGGSGSSANAYRFAGEQLDADLGMYYNRARYYAPNLGRFVARDPYWGHADNPRSQHPYMYAFNNPVNAIDPTGQFGLVSISISISISVTLSSIAIATYTVYKEVKDAKEKYDTLMTTIPGLVINKTIERKQFRSLPYLINSILADDIDKGFGEGLLAKSYDVSVNLGGDETKPLAFIYLLPASLWMGSVARIEGGADIPGKYFRCSYNDYVRSTYSLEIVNGMVSGKILAPILKVVGIWLNYFNLLALIGSTVSDQGTVPAPPDGFSCPIPSSGS